MTTIYNFIAQIELDMNTGKYVGMVPSISGAYTHATIFDELQLNLKEVIGLCLEELGHDELENLSEFIGFPQIKVEICVNCQLSMGIHLSNYCYT